MHEAHGDPRQIDFAPSAFEPVASNRHFVVFAAACLIFTGIGVYAQAHAPSPQIGGHDLVSLYLGTMIGEWGLLFFVWRGMHASGFNLFAFATRWQTPTAAAIDLVLGVGFGFLLVTLDTFVQHQLGSDPARPVQNLLPVGPLEITLWIGVSISAGIVEELVFRGYLMRQLFSRLRSVPLAVIAQAVWFAGMHAYEGAQSIASICALGILFGVAARWRKQLRTNIVAHGVVDLIEGLYPRLIRF